MGNESGLSIINKELSGHLQEDKALDNDSGVLRLIPVQETDSSRQHTDESLLEKSG